MRRFAILAGIVAAVVLLWSGGWLYVAGEIRAQVQALAAGDGLAAPKLTCARLDVAGFPFRFDVTCGEARIVSGDVGVSVTELRASVLVYRPTHAQIFGRGPAILTDAFTGARSRIDWRSLEASLRIDDWRIARASLVMDDIVWTDTLVAETELAQAAHLEAHLLDIPEQHDEAAGLAALAGYATLTGLALSGAAIIEGAAEVEIEVTALPDDIRELQGADLLRRWQQAGGRLKLVRLRGTDGETFIEATGDLALDAEGRPEGVVNLTSRGVVERLEGLIPPELRGLVLGAPTAEGVYAQTINITNGVIFSGLMPAGTVPPLF